MVTDIKDQGKCGGCWAFGSTEVIESVNAFVTGHATELSVQELLDCSTSFSEYGCRGGSASLALAWVYNRSGISTADNYPLQKATVQKPDFKEDCKVDWESRDVSIDSYHQVPRGVEHLLHALTYQPIAVSMDADHNVMLYKSGVFETRSCTAKHGLDHVVLAVGYSNASEVPGENYVIIKNSWGAQWGEQGYIRLAINGVYKYYYGDDGACGVAVQMFYPTKKGGPTPVGPKPSPVQWCDANQTKACPSDQTCCCNKKDGIPTCIWACCPLQNGTCCADFYCCEQETPVCHPDQPKGSGKRCSDSAGLLTRAEATQLPAVPLGLRGHDEL